MEKNFYEWLEEPEEMIGFLFWKITYLWQRKMNKSLKKADLTHTHFALLSGAAWLQKEGEIITQTKLANFTQTNVMVTSKIIKILENKNFIERRNEGDDTRAKYVYITEKGLETLGKASKITEEVNQEFFEPLGDEKEHFTHNMWTLLYSKFDGDDFK
ncbi:MAG: winged helix-turn-helix transcriptional regulator [Methanobacterium sp.]|uniref:MarR family winged helix-turn-helix transcriptional regulator n=1 Tax=Methanobacterium sp. TaxID=2164 RepID=UPI003D64D741|nr:winged helix-turn-helix transcriptional regulator [Methanobacterium sp.]